MLVFVLFVPPAYAVAPKEPYKPPNPTKAELVAYVKERAMEASLNPTRVVSVIECETAGTWNPEIQSKAIYRRSYPEKGIIAGEQEKSFGLAQIHLPAHPSVSYEEATDPYFAVDFLIENWKEGNQGIWTCWVDLYG